MPIKVYPGDIDAVVERFDGTIDVCCFGYDDDPLYGQNVGIAVVMKEVNDAAIRDLYAWTKQHLANYQLPVRWYMIEAMPRTSRGKINRAQVAQACARLTPVDVHRLQELDV